MKTIQYIAILCLCFITGCDEPTFPNCPSDGIYSEECPCKSNMYRWHDLCFFKYDNELLFRGKSQKQTCMEEFQLTFNKFSPMVGFSLMKINGYETFVDVVQRDNLGIYSIILDGVCELTNLPSFQLRLLTKDINDKTETIKGYIYWWNHENQSFHDTEEEIELLRFRY